MKKYYLSLLFISILKTAFGQDPQFTQYYNNPLYLNPALAGATKTGRVVIGYRTQWPKVTHLISQYVSADYFIPLINHNTAFGVGILALKDEAGQNLNLTTTNFNIAGSIEKPIWGNWRIRGGVQYGNFSRRIGNDITSLEFEDQLISGINTLEDIQSILGETINYSDISVGTVLSTRKIWLGVAAHHLNNPDQSITNTSFRDNIQKLQTKWTFHGGWEISNLGRVSKAPFRALRVESMYIKQGQNEQIIAGLNYSHGLLFSSGSQGIGRYDEMGFFSAADLTLTFGVWLRAVPLFNKFDNVTVSQDAIAFQFGIEFDAMKHYSLAVGYSFDRNISSLNINTTGAHEITITVRTKQFFEILNRCDKPLKWSERRHYPINRSYL